MDILPIDGHGGFSNFWLFSFLNLFLAGGGLRERGRENLEQTPH